MPLGLDANIVMIILGWVAGGLVVVVGMRSQLKHLTEEIRRLGTTLTVITGRIDKNDTDIAYLRGRDDEKRFRIRGTP